MPIDYNSEELITLSEAARNLPGTPSASTLHRWRLRGVRNVKLKTLLVGGARRTCGTWLREFFEASTVAADGPQAKPSSCKQSGRKHRCSKQLRKGSSKKACDKAGICDRSSTRAHRS